MLHRSDQQDGSCLSLMRRLNVLLAVKQIGNTYNIVVGFEAFILHFGAPEAFKMTWAGPVLSAT